jgi:enoyl-[acyl-carrier protein] reductase I
LYKKRRHEWGGVLLPYRIWQRCFPDYNDMADKSLLRVSCPQFWIPFVGQKLELILFPNHQRLQRLVNVKGFNGFIAFADKMAPLGMPARLCKLYGRYVSDLTKMVTLQNLYMMGIL